MRLAAKHDATALEHPVRRDDVGDPDVENRAPGELSVGHRVEPDLKSWNVGLDVRELKIVTPLALGQREPEHLGVRARPLAALGRGVSPPAAFGNRLRRIWALPSRRGAVLPAAVQSESR